jgi:hypothetical protein
MSPAGHDYVVRLCDPPRERISPLPVVTTDGYHRRTATHPNQNPFHVASHSISFCPGCVHRIVRNCRTNAKSQNRVGGSVKRSLRSLAMAISRAQDHRQGTSPWRCHPVGTLSGAIGTRQAPQLGTLTATADEKPRFRPRKPDPAEMNHCFVKGPGMLMRSVRVWSFSVIRDRQ